MKLKHIIIASLLILNSGCITLSDFAEGFNAVPYGGMYTTAYGAYLITEDNEEHLVKYREQFPIGFWGNLNVKFWNAFGNYRSTCTWERFQEWKKKPTWEKVVPYWKGRKVNDQWVEIPLQGNELNFMMEERKE